VFVEKREVGFAGGGVVKFWPARWKRSWTSCGEGGRDWSPS
jgi:hypothetical protein